MLLLLGIDDTTNLSCWLNWRVLLCTTWVFTPMIVAIYLIWKFERPPKHSESAAEGTDHRRSWILSDDNTWMPCLEGIPPDLLFFFRVIGFGLLSVALSFDIAVHGGGLYKYYTQWTFTLVTIYFGLGSLLSLHGCCHHKKIAYKVNDLNGGDTEKGLYMPLACEGTTNGNLIQNLGYKENTHTPQSVHLLGCIFQILFQMSAGAVMLTDSVYWFVIFPFLNIEDYEMSFLTVVAHSLNAILLLGDTVLNSLHFPWFRIAYFILWTGIYVIVEWTIHACEAVSWPYPFLYLSRPYAPLWYLVVALLHVPCYGVFALIVKLKEYLLARWFAQSYWCPS